MGLHQAGFEVVGVDVAEQPDYPFEFRRGDALEADLRGFDFVWASPPCQRFSRMSNCKLGLSGKYPDLIEPIRQKLRKWGGPWIIENVPGAPLLDPVLLCGSMFGLPIYRHRLFECYQKLVVLNHPEHVVPTSKAGHWKPGTYVSIAGHCAPIAMARAAMEIGWMCRASLAEAIPPRFSKFLGEQILVGARGVDLGAARPARR